MAPRRLHFGPLVVHSSEPYLAKEVYEAYLRGSLPVARHGWMMCVGGTPVEWNNLGCNVEEDQHRDHACGTSPEQNRHHD